VEDAALIRMMGMPVLEALPSRAVPYERLDPFILVHEGRFRMSEMASKDTKHPHRGFDNLWLQEVFEPQLPEGVGAGPDALVFTSAWRCTSDGVVVVSSDCLTRERPLRSDRTGQLAGTSSK
jgi:hypothetical protein